MMKGKPKELTAYQKIARAKIQKFKRAIDLATTNKSECIHAVTLGPNKSHKRKALEIEKMSSQQQNVNKEVERDNPGRGHAATLGQNKSRGRKALEIEEMPSQQQNVNQEVERDNRGSGHAATACPNKSCRKKALEIEKMPSEQQTVNKEVERDNPGRDMDFPKMEEFDLEWGEGDFEGEGDTSEALNHPQKKKHRGPTKLNYLKNRPRSEKMIVSFNTKGQPVGPNSVVFSSYLGKIARDRVPISFHTWHKIPKGKINIKDKMWDSIRQKFVVPEYAKKQTLKMIGKNWRGHKTRLRCVFYDAYDNDEDRVAHCPPDVKLVDWKAFVAYTSSDEYKKLREIGKKAIANHKMPHTTSRKGFGRLEDELIHKSNGDVPITRSTVWVAGHIKKNGEPVNEFTKGKIDQLSEMNSSTEWGKDDALSQVLGLDPKGRLRGVGYGVTASTLYGVQLCSGKMCELKNQYNDMLKELSDVKKILAQVLNNHESNQSSFQPSLEAFEICNKPLPTRAQCDHRNLSAQSNQNLQTPPMARCDHRSLSSQSNRNLQTPPVARRDHQSLSSQSNRNLNLVRSTKSKVVKCKLFRLVPDDVVAESFWYSDDPTALVHHVPLGPGYSKVSIEVAIQKDALLVRGTTDMKTIEDAVSSFVAWPTSSILML